MSSVNGVNKMESFSSVPREWNDFCRFIEANYRVIYAVALAQVRDADVAQEVAQDVCVRLLLEREKLSHIANPTGWLARVARNTAVDWVRRRQTHSRVFTMMQSWNHDPAVSTTAHQDARETATKGEEKQHLYAALDQLPLEDREILLLHFMDGMDKQQIAGVLEIHPSTVGRHIDKSLRLMKKSLKDFQPDRLATQLTRLRPAEHTSKSVLATLTAVAALAAADKAALAAALAPLPVLSAGAGAGGTALASKSLAGGAANLIRSFSGWTVPVVTGMAVLAGVMVYLGQMSSGNELTGSAGQPKITAIKPAEGGSSDLTKLRASTGKVRNSPAPGLMMKGFSSINAKSPGALMPGVTDGKTLRGTVVDEKRIPIPGAAVTIWIPTPTEEQRDKETSRTVTADAAGRFTFKELPEGGPSGKLLFVSVTATAKGYAHATRGEYDLVLPLPTISMDMQIVLEKPVSLRGIVADEVGNPVANAKVAVISEFDSNKQHYQSGSDANDIFVTYSRADGTFDFKELKPGFVALAIEHPNYAPHLSEAVASNSSGVTIMVNKGVSIVGTVHDGVTTMPGELVTISGTWKGPGTGPTRTVLTDASGYFEAAHLPVFEIDFVDPRLPVPVKGRANWDYNVSVGKYEDAIAPTYGITLEKGETTETVFMNTIDSRATPWNNRRYVSLKGASVEDALNSNGGATLAGTVVTPSNVSTATLVSIVVKNDGGFWRSISIEDGKFQLNHMTASTYHITGHSNGNDGSGTYRLFGPQDVTLRQGELNTVVLTSGEGAVRGRVTGIEAGKKATVQLLTIDPLSPWYQGPGLIIAEQDLDDSGAYQFDGLEAGDYVIAGACGSQMTHAPFTSKAGGVAQCDVTLPPLIDVDGFVFDSVTSQPVQKAKITFFPKNKTVGKTSNQNYVGLTSGVDGRFKTRLAAGVYTLFASRTGSGTQHSEVVDISEGHSQLPAIDLASPVGGIRITRAGLPGNDIMWRQAKFDLVSLTGEDKGQIKPLTGLTYFLDDQTAILQNIPLGTYGLVVRCAPFGDVTAKPFATAYFPDVKLTIPDTFAIVYIPLQNGVPVKLICEPGNYRATWQNPQFWIKDSAGVVIPVQLYQVLHASMGLAPGKYTFGVTLDSGAEQSVEFEVPGIATTEQIVLLRLQ